MGPPVVIGRYHNISLVGLSSVTRDLLDIYCVCDNLITDHKHVRMVIRCQMGALSLDSTLKLDKFWVFNDAVY